MVSTKEKTIGRKAARTESSGPSASALRCRRKFLRLFPGGFRDETYINWERDYKWAAHLQWEEALAEHEFSKLLGSGEFMEIASRAVRVEQRVRYSMLFSFEKMALRDAVKTEEGARTFAEGLYDYLYGAGKVESK